MQSKSLLIAIAAFAVTATSVSAFGPAVLDRVDLTSEQKDALVSAQELRQGGDKDAARDLLLEVGIDETIIRSLHQAAHEARAEVRDAVEAGDYELFLELISGTPLADIITSESDFERFQEAHELRLDGDKEAAREIYDELGIEPKERHGKKHGKHFFADLTDEQREALQVAKESNDRETVRAILDEAGIERPIRR